MTNLAEPHCYSCGVSNRAVCVECNGTYTRYVPSEKRLFEMEIERLQADRDALLKAAQMVLRDYQETHFPVGADLADSIRVFLSKAIEQAEKEG